MHTILSLLLSAVLPSLRDKGALQLELIALRHQVLVLDRKQTTRPRLTRTDRFFWIWLRAFGIVDPAFIPWPAAPDRDSVPAGWKLKGADDARASVGPRLEA